MKLTDQIALMPLTIYMDEAGRWPLAWPVGVWSIIKYQALCLDWCTDSKKLTSHRRSDIMQAIEQLQQDRKLSYGYGDADNTEIDRYGIITALQIASVRSITNLLVQYYRCVLRDHMMQSVWWDNHLFVIVVDRLIHQWITLDWDRINFIRTFCSTPQKVFQRKGLIRDGNHRFGLDTLLWCPVHTIVSWDVKNLYISMASIVAKVHRDHTMAQMDVSYPGWWFGKHKWYGTTSHRLLIDTYISQYRRLSPLHRLTYIHQGDIFPKPSYHRKYYRKTATHITSSQSYTKPKLLLHICCAPDLSRPLRWLKDHFTLYLFRYNPNIHPKKEHDLRYEQFVKLYGLEGGDYHIVEDRYDPKEFFDSFVRYRSLVDSQLWDADRSQILKHAGSMQEWSDRCNPCYLMRLEQGARQAQKLGIVYFTSTLLISPKKVASKLFQFGLQAQQQTTGTQFLRFDFAKHDGYHKASQITKQYDLYRQHYCGCGWTIPKPGEQRSWYVWW